MNLNLIPKEINKEYQMRLYNLAKIFDKNIEDIIEIKSIDFLYTDVNKGIIQFINESIEKCYTINNLSSYFKDVFKLINDNADILSPDEYAIIPNQNGYLVKLTELSRDVKLNDEIIEILNEYNDIKSKLIDKKIIKFLIIEKSENEIKESEKKLKEYEQNVKVAEQKIKYNDINEIKYDYYYKENFKDYKEKLEEYSNYKEKYENLNYKFDLFIKKMLGLIPEKDSGKQKDIKFLYETLWFNKKYKDKNIKEKNKEGKIIQVDNSLWEEINKKAFEKILIFFEKNYYLSNIDSVEEESLKILEIFYKYHQPQVEINLKIVPNQKGFFCKYEELYKEKEINQNFKIMLKNYFYYDISDFLVHKKFEKIVLKEFSINEQIIKKIKNSFYNKLNEDNKNNDDENDDDNDNNDKKIYDEQYSNYIEKAKQLIRFYPKNEEEYVENKEKEESKEKE